MSKRRFFCHDTDLKNNLDAVRELSEIKMEDLPFGETPRGSENLFKGITEYPNFDNGGGSGLFFLKDPKLNLYKSYDIIIRGDVYANVPCEKVNAYYDFAVWGTKGWGKYPFSLEAVWLDGWTHDGAPVWDNDGDWVAAYGNVDYWAYPQIAVDTTKYPDLKPEEIEIYESASITKMSGKYVEGMGYVEKKTEVLFDGTVTTSGGFAPQFTPVNFKVVEGGVYEVTHDGKTYTVEAVSDGYGNFYIGNITLFNSPGSGSGDIPFCYYNGWYCSSQDGDHAVKIIGTFDSVNKIDEEFLPERAVIIPVGLAPGFNGKSEEANLVCNKTPAEIFDLIESGATVLIMFGALVAVMHHYVYEPFRGATFVFLTANENFVRFGRTIVITEQEIKLYSKAPQGIYLTAPNGDYYLLGVNNSGVVEATKTSYPGNGM